MNSVEKLNGNFIGLFDSGFGGISVLNKCIELMPNENYVFYADSKNCPYGKRSKENLIEIGTDIISKFNKYEPKSLIIACNTMSTSDPIALRKPFPQLNIIGTYPNFEHIFEKGMVIENNEYSFDSKNGLKIKKERIKILILATTATTKSEYLNEKINNYKDLFDIYVKPADMMVTAVENDEINSFKLLNELEHLLSPFRGADYIILGCTHFIFAKDVIRKIVGNNTLISSTGDVAAENCYKYMNSKQNIFNKKSTITSAQNKIIIVDAKLDEKRKTIFLNLINNKDNKYEIIWENDIK